MQADSRAAGTIGDALERAAAGDLGVGFIDRGERLKKVLWKEVFQRSRAVAAGLRAVGVRTGDRVGLIYPTSPDFLDAFFGAVLAGAVPVPLYPPVRLGRLAEYHKRTASQLTRAGARLLLADRRARRILGETLEEAGLPLGCREIGQLPKPADRKVPLPSPSPDDLALIQFSSGTTTEPKPVPLDNRSILAQVAALNSFWPDTEGVRHAGVSWLPLYHDMGLIGCLFVALVRPGPLTLIPPELFVTRPAIWLRTLSRTGATISPAPNFAFGLCVDKIEDREMKGVDLSNWRIALCGAETVVPEVLRAFTRRFSQWGFRRHALTPVYGLSEATLAVTFSDLSEPFRSRIFSRIELARGKALEEETQETQEAHEAQETQEAEVGTVEIVSVGRPLSGFSVEVRGESGEVLRERRIGRIFVRGPSLMKGYLGEEEAATAREWLDTGDLGFLLDGELYVTGRAKDVLILQGRNYSPKDVEVALDRIPEVRKGCSVAVSWSRDPQARTESLTVFVERRGGSGRREASALSGDGNGDELAEVCRRAILAGTGLIADELVILEPGTLPRTSSGKIRRQETLRLYREGLLLPPESVGPLRLLRHLARSRAASRRAEAAMAVVTAAPESNP